MAPTVAVLTVLQPSREIFEIPIPRNLKPTAPFAYRSMECVLQLGGLIDMAFVLLDFATSTSEEITNNPDQLSASLALGISFKVTRMLLILTCTGLLHRLSDNSERARKRIERMDDDEASVLNKVIKFGALSCSTGRRHRPRFKKNLL
jgi:hypothetical protein